MKFTTNLLRTTICSLLCLSFCLIHAQKEKAQYDALLSKAFPADGPGATALVAKNGKIIYKNAVGMADLELGVKMGIQNVFEIGSITKQFTSVAILMLMEEGKLSVKDEITKFIPDYPTHGHKITLHHLLNHTSGIKSYTNMGAFSDVWRKDHSPEDLIQEFKFEPMEFAPGEAWNYNNSGYFLLGYIIEKISGMSYEAFVEERIFQPLGMKNTYYGSMSRIIKNRAKGYQKNGENYVNAEYLSLTIPYAAGSIMSTVEDLNIWQMTVKAGKLISKESLEMAYSNTKLNNGDYTNYGYGWGPNEIFGSKTVEHSGGIFGYLSNGIYVPEEDVYVAVLSNCNCNDPGEVSTRMAALAIGKPFPSKESSINLKEADLMKLVGMYKYENGVERNIIFENGQLYSERGGNRSSIYPTSKEHFFFDQSTASYKFTYDAKGELATVYFEDRINSSKGERHSKEIKEKESIEVPASILEQYVGTYEIQKGFELVVSLENEKLMCQATGQGKFQLYAETEQRFFIKEFEAAIEFKKAASGGYDSAVLFQNGQEVLVKRIK
ncbi:MAG: serine hydrolase [Bacteroidota bacterium]